MGRRGGGSDGRRGLRKSVSTRERSGGAAALNMGDVRRHAKVVCVGERTKVGNVIFLRGAGATTCLHTCWNVCMRVCEWARVSLCSHCVSVSVCLCVCANEFCFS